MTREEGKGEGPCMPTLFHELPPFLSPSPPSLLPPPSLPFSLAPSPPSLPPVQSRGSGAALPHQTRGCQVLHLRQAPFCNHQGTDRVPQTKRRWPRDKTEEASTAAAATAEHTLSPVWYGSVSLSGCCLAALNCVHCVLNCLWLEGIGDV